MCWLGIHGAVVIEDDGRKRCAWCKRRVKM
jgi:hypothetical protein